jgi:hypothetical protein
LDGRTGGLISGSQAPDQSPDHQSDPLGVADNGISKPLKGQTFQRSYSSITVVDKPKKGLCQEKHSSFSIIYIISLHFFLILEQRSSKIG